MKKFGLVLAVILSSSCSPEGELTRTLHTPHQRYLDRQNPAAAKKPEEPTAALNAGLPVDCRTESAAPLCLVCQEEASTVYRCYDYRGAWAPETDCHHNIDIVKCLVKNPPFALYLEHKNSHEKLFRENLKVWIDAVHRIWDEKLSAEEKAENGRIIEALEVVSAIITTQTTLEAKDSQALFDILRLTSPEQQTFAADFLQTIQRERLAGKLKLTDVIRDFTALMRQTHGPSSLFEKFGAMSLEGLEEEGTP